MRYRARLARLWRWYSFGLRDNGLVYFRHWRACERMRRECFSYLDSKGNG